MDLEQPRGPVLPYIDPHSHGRVPNIIFSRYYSLTPPDETVVPKLIENLEKLMESEYPAGKIPAELVPKELSELIDLLMQDERAMSFIENVVLPAKIGHQTDFFRDKLSELLQDPTMWDLTDPFASLKETAGFQIDFLHVDTKSKPGELRIGFSPEISTRFRSGWHQVAMEGTATYPLKDQDGNPTTIESQPAPGSIVLWESSTGVHDVPTMDQETLDAVGGQRSFGSITVSFDRLIARAQELNGEYMRELNSSIGNYASLDDAPPALDF